MSSFDAVHYYPPGPEAQVWGLSVTGLGRTRIAPGLQYPPYHDLHTQQQHALPWQLGRRLDAWQCVCIADGRGSLETEDQPLSTINGPSLCWLRPQVWHRYRPDVDSGWTEYWVEFCGPSAEYLDRRHLAAASLIWPIGQASTLLALFDALIRDARAEQPFLREQLATGCSRLLIEALSLLRQRHEEHHPSRLALQAARQYMNQHFAEALQVEGIAHQAGMNYHQFRRAFTACFGLAPKAYLMRRRLDHALELLQQPTLSFDAIAKRCGLSNANYFSRCCRTHLGRTPSELRSSS